MSFPTLVKQITIGSYTLRLLLQDQCAWIEFNSQLFNHIWLLGQHLPLLSDPHYIQEFADISNFLWKGSQFELIACAANYQKYYNTQVKLEKNCPTDIFPYRLTDYKIFDVSVMHDPCLKEEHLHYFVYHVVTGVPYRVVCPFPYTSLSTLVHYQILPVKVELIEESLKTKEQKNNLEQAY